MFAVFFAAGSLTLYAVSDGDVSTTVVILLGGVLIAITARQVLLLVDNDRLRASLEQRVIERSTELAEVTQRTDLLVDSVEDGVYGVDSQGRVTFVNPAGARLLGARRGALLGQYAHETFHSHPLADCYLRTIQRNGLAITGIDDAYRSSDGRLVPVEVSASPMADPRGEAIQRPRCGRGVPRRDPATGGGPDEERVRLVGQPRAEDAADRDPRLARAARRRSAR